MQVETAKTAAGTNALPEIIDPFTGEVLDSSQIDQLANLYLACHEEEQRIGAVRKLIAHLLMDMTEGDAKTRRLRGEQRRVKVELPDDSWDGFRLKEVWHAYPLIAPSYLKIERIGVQLREIHKMANETGAPDFETFKRMVMDANRGPTGTPKITIEE